MTAGTLLQPAPVHETTRAPSSGSQQLLSENISKAILILSSKVFPQILTCNSSHHKKALNSSLQAPLPAAYHPDHAASERVRTWILSWPQPCLPCGVPAHRQGSAVLQQTPSHLFLKINLLPDVSYRIPDLDLVGMDQTDTEQIDAYDGSEFPRIKCVTIDSPALPVPADRRSPARLGPESTT